MFEYLASIWQNVVVALGSSGQTREIEDERKLMKMSIIQMDLDQCHRVSVLHNLNVFSAPSHYINIIENIHYHYINYINIGHFTLILKTCVLHKNCCK
jgi:hypothetical protein